MVGIIVTIKSVALSFPVGDNKKLRKPVTLQQGIKLNFCSGHGHFQCITDENCKVIDKIISTYSKPDTLKFQIEFLQKSCEIAFCAISVCDH